MINKTSLLKFAWVFSSLISAPKENLLVLEPEQKPATIIFPHGLGMDAKSRQEMIIKNELNKKFSGAKFIFPEASVRKVNIDAGSTDPDFGKGQKMRSWFDIKWKWEEIKNPLELEEFEKITTFDQKELKESIKQIDKIIKQEIKKGVPADRIIMVGFSQGGALTAAMALASKYKLGGFVIIAGWLPNREQLVKETKRNNFLNKETPILFCHGVADEWVPYWLGKKHAEYLNEKDYNVSFISFDSLKHEADQKVFQRVNEFLKEILNSQTQYEAKIEQRQQRIENYLLRHRRWWSF